MSPDLPMEVVEHTVDFLHDDIHALAACALASRALLLPARLHIWDEVTVPVQYYAHVRIHGLLEILGANADIASLVRCLILRGVLFPQCRIPIWSCWDYSPGTMHLWEKLSNLRVLRFSTLRFNLALHQLLPVAYALPNLEEVAVVACRAILPREYPARTPYRESIVALDSPPTLKRLSVVGGSVSWSYLEGLARLLLEPGMLAPLETLDRSCIEQSSKFKNATYDRSTTLSSHVWAPVIASLGSTLHHLTLGLLGVECSPENLANLYGSIAQCARLRSLGIRCNVMKYPAEGDSRRPFVFIDMLAELLSGSSSVHPPFPALEALSVGWSKALVPVPPGCADACRKLALALEAQSGCPLLKRLDVAGTTVRSTPIRVSTEQEEEVAAQEPVLRACFERVVVAGVQLAVHLCVA